MNGRGVGTKGMWAARAALVLAASVCGIGGGASAQATGAPPMTPTDCFAEFAKNIDTCKRKFSGGIITTASERMILSACLEGAKAVLDDCLKHAHS